MPLFSDYDLHPPVVEALAAMGYQEPTPIQAKTLPLVLARKDVIGLAQTGSGKTAACAIPMCHLVDPSKPCVQALIVVPTRELSLQYATETQKIGARRGVKAFALLGGEDMGMQLAKLKDGVQVLVATPGRLIDLIYSRSIDLSHVETLILDEADEMLGMGFYDDLEFIINCLNHDHQTLLFSATMPKQISKIAKHHMKSPEEIVLTKEVTSPETIRHLFAYCPHPKKPEKLLELMKEEKLEQAIVFCQSRRGVEKLCDFLKRKLDGVDLLHGGMSQDVRTVITNKFRKGRVKYLVATDVAARGLDFSGVTHVFVSDLSSDIDGYVHRAGRTGRQEREGTVISLVTDRELSIVARIEKRIKRKAEWLVPPPSRGRRSTGTQSRSAAKKGKPSQGNNRSSGSSKSRVTIRLKNSPPPSEG